MTFPRSMSPVWPHAAVWSTSALTPNSLLWVRFWSATSWERCPSKCQIYTRRLRHARWLPAPKSLTYFCICISQRHSHLSPLLRIANKDQTRTHDVHVLFALFAYCPISRMNPIAGENWREEKRRGVEWDHCWHTTNMCYIAALQQCYLLEESHHQEN